MAVKIIKIWGDLTPYEKALNKQHSLVKEVQQHSTLGGVLGYEHPKVITMGVRSQPDLDLLESKTFYQQQGIELVKVNRGGEATMHNPGQLVIYPIVHLPSINLKVKDYICVLQKTTIACLKDQGVEAFGGDKEPGVYTRQGKIAMIGVKVSRGVSYHGISINIENDLLDFNSIQSCGVKSQSFDKLSHYNTKINTYSFFGLWFDKFLASIPK